MIIARTENYDAQLLSCAPESLKLIARNGVSYENIDLTEAKKRKIAVTAVRGANAKAVADGTLALMLSVARRLPAVDRSVRSGGWNGFVADDINHKTLGILGFGAIGKEVAKRVRGFDMTVLAYSPPDDLCRTLKNGTIPGAALDVFEREPTGNSALLELENTVFSPHCAGRSAGAIAEMGRVNTENILAVSKGEWCGGVILGPFRTGWE